MPKYEIDYFSDGKIRTELLELAPGEADEKLVTVAAVALAGRDKHFSKIRRITVHRPSELGTMFVCVYDHRKGVANAKA